MTATHEHSKEPREPSERLPKQSTAKSPFAGVTPTSFQRLWKRRRKPWDLLLDSFDWIFVDRQGLWGLLKMVSTIVVVLYVIMLYVYFDVGQFVNFPGRSVGK